MALHAIRILFVIVVLSMVIAYTLGSSETKGKEVDATSYLTLTGLIAASAVALVIVDMVWKRKRLKELSGLFFGVLAGLVLAYAMALIVDLFAEVFREVLHNPRPETIALVKNLLGVASVFMCVTFVLQTKDDFRFLIPYVEFSRETKGARPMLLDTSVIIDGRIADIAETRIMESAVVVPRFILAELQAIADSEGKLKRNRGRRGLDILNRLQTSESIDIQILDAHVQEVEDAADVDAKLVALAEHLNGRVITNDYNLNKVAQVRGVDVININDLANALKPIVLPGETLSVRVIKSGEEPGQGVGYLEDGTMVVVEQGAGHIEKEVTIAVTSILQTSAGRMIFGRLEGDRPPARSSRRPR